MADQTKIAAEIRETFGKGAARKLRASGRVPAVLYGHGTDPQHLSLPGHDVFLLVRKANALVELDIAGEPQLALVKDVQRDPVRQIIEHLDLVVINRNERVQVDVAVHVVGDPISGTIVELDAKSLTLEVLATSIPEGVEINVEGAEEGTRVYAKDVALPSGAVLLSDPEALVVDVIAPTAKDLGETPAEAAEASEDAAE